MIFLWFMTKLVKEVFGVSVVTLLVFLVVEDVKMGFVLNYFDLGKLFLFCIAMGAVYLILSKFEELPQRHLSTSLEAGKTEHPCTRTR